VDFDPSSSLTLPAEGLTMELSKQCLKEVLANYLETAFSKFLPEAIKEAVSKSDLFIGQDFLSIEQAVRRYNVCRKTVHNYHNRGYITLHSSEGKTFVSIRELEAHIKKNPLPGKDNQR
jgi:hypothetical protein